MKILLFGTVLLLISFTLHVLIWKIRLPVRQTKVLLQVFFGVLLAGIAIFYYLPPSFEIFGMSAPRLISEIVQTIIYFVSFTLAYMITYSAIEADSPSLLMVMLISRKKKEGLEIEIFEREMSDEILIKPRIKDLLLDKMLVYDGRRYQMTFKGRLMAKIFIFYRKLLNAPRGG